MSNSVRRSEFHIFVDFTGTHGEGTAEDPWEDEDVIDLVRRIGAACADDTDTGFFCCFVIDFRHRVSHGKDDSVFIHCP